MQSAGIGYATQALHAVREWSDVLSSWLQISQLEFSRDRKMMSVRCRRRDQDTLFVKGAPEAVIARCSRVSQTRPPHGCMIAGKRWCCCLAPCSSSSLLHDTATALNQRWGAVLRRTDLWL